MPVLEQQLLGLTWRGRKIDHSPGEHDDWANAAVGALLLARSAKAPPSLQIPQEEWDELCAIARDYMGSAVWCPDGLGGGFFGSRHPGHVYDEDLGRWM